MIITITGVPGTGKTAVAKELAKLTGYSVVSINDLVNKKKIKSSYDRKRKSRIVDEKLLGKNIRKMLGKKKSCIIEGLLAHYARSDLCVVLRTNPAVLEGRLKKRGWSAEKIMENVQAEILDSIVIEAAGWNKNIAEIDTSRKTAKSAAALIKQLLNNHAMQKKYIAGRIDWMEMYRKYLVG